MSLVKVQERVSTVANEINDIQNEIYKKLTDLKLKEEAWESVLNSMQECALAAADRIDFNIGGQLFSTSKKTLLRVKGTFFEGLLSSGKWDPKTHGVYFLDRDPTYFGMILNYLRDEASITRMFVVNRHSERQLLKAELDFYNIHISFTRPASTKLSQLDDAAKGVVKAFEERARPAGKRDKNSFFEPNSKFISMDRLKRIVCKVDGSPDNWDCAVIGAKPTTHKAVFRILSSGKNGNVMVGLAEKQSFDPNGVNSGRCMWAVYLQDGTFRVPNGTGYNLDPIRHGGSVEFTYEADKKTIWVKIGSGPQRLFATEVVTEGPLFPAVELRDMKSAIKLLYNY